MATALYRRYRPDTFAEVIGQEHVTDPLRTALRSGRVGQAYLFSGPRGCGKTTSARILARCLNCAQGPTDTPCGTCDSCVELARGGPGSLDVVEIDAASHGGVDDARELRERATFAPARDRQKIFIIDEAHMVTPQGFNALLKIVEEPPPHIAFIFATTEPDKVLGTIRSRTHHYPFRLVPPQVLQAHLQHVCDAEGVAVGPGVLPLVVRAGAGSVRDSLSVLDQLAAGSSEGGIDYEHAVGLLGYTHATLLDDVTAAFAAGDGATVFQVVDRVISSGQDPRRFVDDLLQRLRDLVVVQAVGDGAQHVFPGVPADQLERMAVQAAGFGAAQLSRAADLANTAATEMTGATSPRLHLELLCARMLLPAADDGARGLAARLDRVERRLEVPGQVPAAGAGNAAPSAAPSTPAAARPSADVPPAEAPGAGESRGAQHVREVMARRREGGDRPEAPPQPAASPVPQPADRAAGEPDERVPDPVREEVPVRGAGEVAPPGASEPAGGDEPDDAPPTTVAVAPDPVGGALSDAPPGLDSTEAVRRMWPDVLDHLATVKRRTWTRVSQDAQVAHVDDQRVVLQFARPNTLQAFSIGPHADFVREALIAVLGLDRVVVAVNAGTSLPGASGGAPRPSGPPPGEQRETAPESGGPAPARRREGVERAEPAGSPETPAGRPARDDHGQDARPSGAQTEQRPGPSLEQHPGPRSEPQPERRADASPQGRPEVPRRAAPARSQPERTRSRAAAPPPWDDVPPPEPPDEGEPPPPEFDDPWNTETGPRAAARPGAPADASPARGTAGQPVEQPAARPVVQAPPVATAPVSPPAPAAPAPVPAPAQQTPRGPLRGADLARSALGARAGLGAPAAGDGAPSAPARPDDEPSRDDDDAEGSGQVGLAVVERVLGGRVLSVDQRS